MLRKQGIFLALLAFLVFSTISITHVHASSADDPPVDFSELQKKCAVIEVKLNGSQHTITCTKPKSSVKGNSIPNTGQTNCAFSDTMEIKNYSYSGDLCFSGLGYLGVKIYQVDEIDNHHPFYQEWILEYDPSGVFCTIEPNDYALFTTSNPAYVTQLDINGSNGGDCPRL